ncbi:2-hydroxychromene-2-carboxylate isomerase [Phenylobacterium kunshanense]|uniref:2-hydroxychromene-2-carboxylate isomerase n=1 Tax=Phenylobacterium kunshanense TaxID=1445034 RepID=A0A328BQ68_9CAUL|nr:2-hydroxychromene-2-carboxylate isomerase [Phenylobacterium kunshanense]RAK68641.1 2-hydroxychromene-2-carboxylate isomerase [Phenylobacterium kunshanense]
MGKTVEFLFDVGSPASYIAFKRLPGIAERTGAEIDYRPFLLGGVFKATGNRSPAETPAKAAWTSRDLARFAAKHDVPFERNPHFPINTLHLMRGAAGLQGDPRFMPYLEAVFEAMWRTPRNLGNPAEMAPVLERAGIGAEAFRELIEDEATKARLKSTTEDAVARGAFGAPTFFVDGELYFGQDRLDWVEEALSA